MIPDSILSLDVSSTAIGHALFSNGQLADCGVVKAGSSDFGRRLDKLAAAVDSIIAGEPYRPDLVVMEWNEGRSIKWLTSKGRSAQSTAPLCHAQGAIYGRLRAAGFEVECVGDLEWTAQFPPKERAKEKRAVRVVRRYPDFQHVWAIDEGFDAADAVGVGEFAIGRRKLADLVSRGKSLATSIPRGVRKRAE